MWIILRLATSVIVGVVKFLWRRHGPEHHERTGGIDWVYSRQRNKRKVVSTTYGIRFQHPVYFRLSREGGLDRFFKAVGFSREIQSGDKEFDREIYVACDHPALAPLLQEDKRAREAVLELFRQRDVLRLFSDGEHLWARRNGDELPNRDALECLTRIRAAFQSVPAVHVRALRDPFLWKALTVEAIAWSIAWYGAPAIIELTAKSHPQYFNWAPVIEAGLVAALGIFGGLLALSWFLLRGSSRAHRVFVESALVLAVGVPLSSIELVSDANIAFDRGAAVVVEPTVTSKHTRISRGRRRRTRTHYHLVTESPANAAQWIPRSIEVSSGIYHGVSPGDRLIVSIRPGALDFAWVESVRPKR